MKMCLAVILFFLTLETNAAFLMPSVTQQRIQCTDDSTSGIRKPCNYPSGNYETISTDQLQPKSVFDWVDSIATAMGVPPGFEKM